MAVKRESHTPPRPAAAWPAVLLRFGRLHTLVATTVQVAALAAVARAAGGGPSGLGLALTWLACLGANVYVVGLNQLTDVAIDRVNKPDLPLASRELSRPAGRRIILVAAVVALALGLAQSVALTLTLLATMLVGTLYSLPPRLKNRPLLAAVSIALVRGVVANLGLYLHFTGAVGPPPARFWVAVAFFFGFGLIIALFKDIPDHTGDRRFGVGTFAVRWGQRPAFLVGRALLTALYLLPIGAALARGGAAGVGLAVAHGALLAVFWAVSLRTEPERPRSMFRLYFVLWGLFYAEYGLLAVFAW